MGKLLRPQDKLLFSLAFLGDLFEDVRDAGGIMSASYKSVYGFVPSRFGKTNFANMVSRNLRTENIEKITKNNEVYLRLTSNGAGKVTRDFPLFRIINKPWDRRWRIVVFDIPQKLAKSRDRLRSKLRELGLGMLQKSIWISPHNFVEDIREFLLLQGLSSMAFVLEAKNIAGLNDQEIAKQIFFTNKLNREYEDLFTEFSESKKEGKTKLMKNLRSKWLDLLLKDPLLPKELLPKPWYGDKVRLLILSKKNN